MSLFFQKIKNFYQRYERYLSATALLVGFITDNLTLRQTDLLLGNLILFSYLMIAGGGIILVRLHQDGRIPSTRLQEITPIFLLLVQYAFGALFSGYFVFYSRSGSLTISLLFLIFILVLLIGNEFFRTQYKKFVFQVSIFYVALFSFVIFFIPILTSTMGTETFLLSGAVSILLIAILTYGLFRIAPIRFMEEKNTLLKSICGIFLFINLLYFANIIPPVPLALKDIGVYHAVEKRSGGGYVVYKEESPLKIFEVWDTVFHHTPGEPAYVYSAVFAPTDLNTQIFHQWQYFNEVEKTWVTTSNIPFPITGGRDEGYRGYSFKKDIVPGRWRVDVMTARGQIVGRINFTVVSVSTKPSLSVEFK